MLVFDIVQPNFAQLAAGFWTNPTDIGRAVILFSFGVVEMI